MAITPSSSVRSIRGMTSLVTRVLLASTEVPQSPAT